MISESDLSQLTKKIYSSYGLDFNNYAFESLGRRIQRLMTLKGMRDINELLQRIEEESWFKKELLEQITVNVTEMFRDPKAWTTLKNKVMPDLMRKKKILKIWHAGCSSGEEVVSMLILLKENKWLDRVEITATDLDESIIEVAQNGAFPRSNILLYERNYENYGGTQVFPTYFAESGDKFLFDSELLAKVKFDVLDLVKEPPKEGYDLILCRNVMIYFNQDLQNIVLGKFRNALGILDYLMIGSTESLLWCQDAKHFKPVDPNEKIYQRFY